MSTVLLNNKLCAVEENSTLVQVLEQNGILASKGIAVAINNEVIPKTEWQSKTLNDNDKITVIRATQGG